MLMRMCIVNQGSSWASPRTNTGLALTVAAQTRRIEYQYASSSSAASSSGGIALPLVATAEDFARVSDILLRV